MYSRERTTLPEECSLKEIFLAKPRNGTEGFHLTEEWQVVGTGGEFYETWSPSLTFSISSTAILTDKANS